MHRITYINGFVYESKVYSHASLAPYNAAEVMMLDNEYGLKAGNPANIIVLNESSVFEAIRKRVGVLASVRNGNFLFRRREPEYEISLAL